MVFLPFLSLMENKHHAKRRPDSLCVQKRRTALHTRGNASVLGLGSVSHWEGPGNPHQGVLGLPSVLPLFMQ